MTFETLPHLAVLSFQLINFFLLLPQHLHHIQKDALVVIDFCVLSYVHDGSFLLLSDRQSRIIPDIAATEIFLIEAYLDFAAQMLIITQAIMQP
mgnify:FL=1